MVARIAIAACRATSTSPPTDLYPDPDSVLLAACLTARGVEAQLVSWDDPSVDWSDWSVVVARSTWDSVDRPVEYVAWAHGVPRLLNPAALIEWNIDKRYLQRLSVPTVPTDWINPGAKWITPDGEYVVKPTISAGGRETARYGPGGEEAAQHHVNRLLAAGHTVMVQPYLPAVDEPGEISLIFIAGSLTHAVRKGPVLEVGGGIHERPWERMTFRGTTTPTAHERDIAAKAIAEVGSPCYGRVDLIDGLVVEVELIDPNLSLGLFPAAAEQLADALVRECG